ncbi:MAG TPA: site-specific integrase [Pyrinomonadaceae bacterium]|nr:site-specific integrase [Pyrinomonadaceae bacterium]
MQLGQAIDDFTKGYFGTHQRSNKTRVAYCSDLSQFRAYAGEDRTLRGLSELLIEDGAARSSEGGLLAGINASEIVVLKVCCSYWVRKGALRQSPFWRIKLSFGRIE